MNRTRFAFLCIGHAYDHLFMLLFPTVVLTLGPRFELSYDEVMLLAVPGFVAFAAGAVPAGWLGDRWSRSGMMAVFFIGIGGAAILTGFASEPWEIAGGLFLIGLFASIYHPVGIAMVVQGHDKVGRLLGINGVAGNIGIALAAIIAGALSDFISWRAAYYVPGAVAVATGLAYLWASRGWPLAEKIAGPKQHDIRRAFSASPEARQAILRAVAVLTVGALLAGIVFQSSTIALPKLFEERLGDLAGSPLGVGGLVSLVVGIAAFAQIAAGHLIDRFSPKLVWIGLLLVQVPLLVVIGMISQTGLLIVSFVALVIIFGEIPIQDTLLARHTPEHLRSRVFGLKFALALGASALAVPIIVGLHTTEGGFTWLFGLLAACALTLGAIAFWLPARPHHLEVERPAE
jgi:MFS family permease